MVTMWDMCIVKFLLLRLPLESHLFHVHAPDEAIVSTEFIYLRKLS